jgi:hypothetical protein
VSYSRFGGRPRSLICRPVRRRYVYHPIAEG